MKQSDGMMGIRWRPIVTILRQRGEAPDAGSTEGVVGLKVQGRARMSAGHRIVMDITWLTDRIAVGGGIWTAENMATVARAGVTHVINMQIEFDDKPLGLEHGIE